MRKCTVEGCGGKHKGHGYCYKHLRRLRRYGDIHALKMRPDGTGKIRRDGYIDRKINGKMMLEHRWLWEQAHGPIPANCVVHHINHIRDDNRLENLCLMSVEEHNAHHLGDRLSGRKPAIVRGGCVVVGCSKAATTGPWCGTHYLRWHTNGFMYYRESYAIRMGVAA